MASHRQIKSMRLHPHRPLPRWRLTALIRDAGYWPEWCDLIDLMNGLCSQANHSSIDWTHKQLRLNINFWRHLPSRAGKFEFLPARHNFDLSCKRCDRMNMKVTFPYVLYLYQLLFSCYSFICAVEKILDFTCVTVSLKSHDKILPAMQGRHTLIFNYPSAI